MSAPTHRIRRCRGNTSAWCLVALRDDGTESDISYTTSNTLDGLLKHAKGLLPERGDLVEILYYAEDTP